MSPVLATETLGENSMWAGKEEVFESGVIDRNPRGNSEWAGREVSRPVLSTEANWPDGTRTAVFMLVSKFVYGVVSAKENSPESCGLLQRLYGIYIHENYKLLSVHFVLLIIVNIITKIGLLA